MIRTRLRVRRILLSVIKIERDKQVIYDCLNKIEKETPRSRGQYSIQGLMLYRYGELAIQDWSTKEIVQKVNAVHELRR